MGKSYAREGFHDPNASFVNHPYDDDDASVNYTMPLDEGEFLGFLNFTEELHGLDSHDVLSRFKNSAVLNSGSRSLWFDDWISAGPFEQTATSTTFSVGRSDFPEYFLTIIEVSDGGEPIGFDLVFERNTGSPGYPVKEAYRHYTFRVTENAETSELQIASYRGSSPSAFRVETLRFEDPNRWVLSTTDGSGAPVRESSVAFSEVAGPFQSPLVGGWQAEIIDSGVIDSHTHPSRREVREFVTVEWEPAFLQPNMDANSSIPFASSFKQDRLVRRELLSEVTGDAGTAVDFAYFTAYSEEEMTSFLQLQSVIGRPANSAEVLNWEAYRYHKHHWKNGAVSGAAAREGFTYLSGKPGRLYEKFEPFENMPASPEGDLESGRVTRYYFDTSGLSEYQFSDVVVGKFVRIDGTLVEGTVGGWGETGRVDPDFPKSKRFQALTRRNSENAWDVDRRTILETSSWRRHVEWKDQAGYIHDESGAWQLIFRDFGEAEETSGGINGSPLRQSFTYIKRGAEWSLPEAGLPDQDPSWNPGSSFAQAPYYARATVITPSTGQWADGLACVYPGRSTLERQYLNRYSEVIRTETYVWAGGSGVVATSDPTAWKLISWKNNIYSDHRLVSSVDHQGILDQRFYFGVGSPFYGLLERSVDGSGIETHYAYDALGRVTRTTVSAATVAPAGHSIDLPQIVTETTFDGGGRQVRVRVNGQLANVRRYDLAGRLLAELNGDGDGVQRDYAQIAQRITTETAVWGVGAWSDLWNTSVTATLLAHPAAPSKTTTENYRDGSVFSKTVSDVAASQNSTIVDRDQINVFLGGYKDCPPDTVLMTISKLGSVDPVTGFTSQSETYTGYDLIGRKTFSETPSVESDKRVRQEFAYDDPFDSENESWKDYSVSPSITHEFTWHEESGTGKLARVSTIAVKDDGSFTSIGADTVLTYDDLGRLQIRTLEVESGHVQSADSFMDPASPRVETHTYGYVQIPTSTGDWWFEQSTSVLTDDNDDNASLVVSRTRDRVSGFPDPASNGGVALAAESWSWGIDEGVTAAAATVSKSYLNRSAKLSGTVITQPGGRTTESYSSGGFNLLTCEPGGAKTYNLFDSQGRIHQVIGPRGVVSEERHYKTAGGSKLDYVKAPTADDPAPNVVKTFAYESGASGGRLVTETDALGHTTHFDYDARGAVIHTWGTKVYPVAYEYDEFGRKTRMITYRDESAFDFSGETWPNPPLGVGDLTLWAFDPGTGLLTSKSDAKGQVTQYGYDAFNRPNARLLPTGKLKLTTYNTQTGEVFSQKYYSNATSLTGSFPIDGSTPSVYYAYDRRGQVERVKDGTGTRTFTYEDTNELDARGLLHREAMQMGSQTYAIEYDYDSALRRLFKIKHGLGTADHTMQFGYSGSGRVGALQSVTATAPGFPDRDFSYGYLSDTSWVETVTSGSLTQTRAYELNRSMVSGISATWGSSRMLGEVTHHRDALGRIDWLERSGELYGGYAGGGLHQDFLYTARGELKFSGTAALGESARYLPGRTIQLGYDGQGNREFVDVDLKRAHAYTPGPGNEYTSVTYGDHAAGVSGLASGAGSVRVGDEKAAFRGEDGFFYRGYPAETSAAWLTEDIFAFSEAPAGGYPGSYTAGKKTVYLPPVNTAPVYDACGNLTADGRWTYVYDGENRLVSMHSVKAHPADGQWRELRFKYDYLGRRVQKEVNAPYDPGGDSDTLSRTGYAYWEWHLLAEVNLLGGSPTPLRHFAWGLDKEGVRPGAGGVGGLLGVFEQSDHSAHLALNDYLGNVIGLVDGASGALTATYEYDPFGKEIRATGSHAQKNPFGFSSQYTDRESELIYFGFRYYMPNWGRFLNRDPIEEAGGENLYRFVSNDPVNQWDLLGLWKVSVGIGWIYAVKIDISFDPDTGARSAGFTMGLGVGAAVSFTETDEQSESSDVVAQSGDDVEFGSDDNEYKVGFAGSAGVGILFASVGAEVSLDASFGDEGTMSVEGNTTGSGGIGVAQISKTTESNIGGNVAEGTLGSKTEVHEAEGSWSVGGLAIVGIHFEHVQNAPDDSPESDSD